jgi:hypothetical protein
MLERGLVHYAPRVELERIRQSVAETSISPLRPTAGRAGRYSYFQHVPTVLFSLGHAAHCPHIQRRRPRAALDPEPPPAKRVYRAVNNAELGDELGDDGA